MSGMAGGTTGIRNQNNLLFANPARNKQAFIVIQRELLR